MGNLVHDKFMQIFRDTKGVKLLENERSIAITDAESDIVITGRLDNLIVLEKDGVPRIVDIKTTKSLAYTDSAKEDHVLQIMPYMKAMSILDGAIIYVEKNTLKQKTFEVPYSKEAMKKVWHRAEELHLHLINGMVPKPESKLVGRAWECAYCQYSQECSKQG